MRTCGGWVGRSEGEIAPANDYSLLCTLGGLRDGAGAGKQTTIHPPDGFVIAFGRNRIPFGAVGILRSAHNDVVLILGDQ